jgi:MOSC domain-containing protein YiiM
MSQPLGTVVAIQIAPKAGEPLRTVETAHAIPGFGLVGDRYHAKAGAFSKKSGGGRDVTLIELEAIEALARDYQIEVKPTDTRRNIVTRGVALNHLVGREFTVGRVRLRGVLLCEPCGYLAKLTQEKVREGLVHRGGLRCDVLTESSIRVGDMIGA